eukprot:TRINITY_DN2624_c0_g1_i13.p1 TRINITY_DN2624_c0_g1~~TRINITY_DN2624_c0_g1_i13.p1  ORF type:complete len:408 (-),score=80.42 TRINITY_DN2624_c0_g1_i13:341-1564(-)
MITKENSKNKKNKMKNSFLQTSRMSWKKTKRRRMSSKKTKRTRRKTSKRFSNNNRSQTSRSYPKSSRVPRVGIWILLSRLGMTGKENQKNARKFRKKNFGLLQQQKKDLKEDLGSVFLQQTESDMQELEQMISFKRQASDWGQDSSEESWDDRGQYRQQQQDKRSFENQQDEEWNKVLEDKIQENLQVQLKQEAEDDDDEYVDNEEEYNQDEIHESLLKQKREVFQDFEDDGQSTRNYQQGERRSGGGKPGQRGSLQSYTPWKQPGRSMVDQRDLGRQGWGKRKNQVESTTFKKFEDDDEYLQLQFDNEDQDEDEDEYMDVDEGKRTGDQKWYSHEQNQFRREKKQKPSKNQQKNKKKGPRPRKQPEIKINKGWVSGGHDDEELDWGELGSDLGKYQSSESSKWFQG